METSNSRVNRGKGVLLGIVAGVGYPPDLKALEGNMWSTVTERSGIKILDPLKPGEIPFWDKPSSRPLLETIDRWLHVHGNSPTVRILECRYGILDGQLKTDSAVNQLLSLHTAGQRLEKLAIERLKTLLMTEQEFRMYGLSYPYPTRNHR